MVDVMDYPRLEQAAGWGDEDAGRGGGDAAPATAWVGSAADRA